MLVACTSARAEWLEASSDHFVVYGDTDEKNLRRFAEQLERYDAAMAFVTGVQRSKPAKAARVTVFMAGNEAAVRRLHGQNGGNSSRYVAGFYLTQLAGPIAFIPNVVAARGKDQAVGFSMFVLLHEYAHHFNSMNSRFPAPRWLAEGSAEFFGSASFGEDGSVIVGRAANHRGPELFEAVDVTVTDLVDPDQYERRKGKSRAYDAYYGRAWLLYHYLVFEPKRQGQLVAYVKALHAGRSSREAAEEAFGDLKALDKETDAYLNRRKLMAFSIPASELSTGKVGLRRLSPGEAAIMPVVMRSKRGVSKSTAADVVADARVIAAKYPTDPAVLAALAEAEYDAGNDDGAVTAADAALAIDPNIVNAHLQKGYALLRKARVSGDGSALRDARRSFLTMNRIDNDHPVPLVCFYLSQLLAGGKPTANAVAGLESAVQLAPFADGIKLMLAERRLLDGRPDEARRLIQPVAYDVHGGGQATKLREMLARLESGAPDALKAVAEELGAMTRTTAGEDPDRPDSGSKISVQRTDRDVLEGRRRR